MTSNVQGQHATVRKRLHDAIPASTVQAGGMDEEDGCTVASHSHVAILSSATRDLSQRRLLSHRSKSGIDTVRFVHDFGQPESRQRSGDKLRAAQPTVSFNAKLVRRVSRRGVSYPFWRRRHLLTGIRQLSHASADLRAAAPDRPVADQLLHGAKGCDLLPLSGSPVSRLVRGGSPRRRAETRSAKS